MRDLRLSQTHSIVGYDAMLFARISEEIIVLIPEEGDSEILRNVDSFNGGLLCQSIYFIG